MGIRGQNLKPKVFLENPNSTAVLFQDHYKFDQRNPRVRELIDIFQTKLVVSSRASNSGNSLRGKKEKF